MKNKAIVANIGHFDNEIDMAGLAKVPGIAKTEIKPQVHEWTFDDGDSIIVLSEGRLLNLGNATGHPSFVMSNSFSNQTIAQIELFTKTDEYVDEEGAPKVETLPKHLDEKVARAAPRRARASGSPSSPRSRPSTSASTSPARTSRSTTATEFHDPGRARTGREPRPVCRGEPTAYRLRLVRAGAPTPPKG